MNLLGGGKGRGEIKRGTSKARTSRREAKPSRGTIERY